MRKIYRWKFLREGFRSKKGNLKWKIGVWNRVEGKLSMCENGLHCSRSVFDAFRYVRGEILARVECRGDHIIGTDKECWREMRVVKAYEWAKKDSVAIAIDAARLVLPIFEKIYPNDKRPRKAIEAAINWLKNPTKKNRKAAIMAAKEAGEAAEEALWDVPIEKVIEANKRWGAAEAASDAAYAAGREDLILATDDLWKELISVEMASKTAIRKLRACFNKQVKELKEIKKEESWLTKILKKIKTIKVDNQKNMKNDRNIITPSKLRRAIKHLSQEWQKIVKNKRVIEVEQVRESGDLLDQGD